MDTPSQIDTSQNPLQLVEAEMALVDQVIQTRLDTGVPLVREVASYIIAAGGKRLRPRLLLLMSGALEALHPQRHQLATVVEFIHTATLLHDDVVDESSLRRGRPTANHAFGNAASVLVGDFLYSRAFQMMVEIDHMRVLSVLSDATNVIAEGEVEQLLNIGNVNLNESDYLRVIRNKTAKLFEASTRLAAVLAESNEQVEANCADYGQALGTAFQIVDDVLDYEGKAEELGKNLGDDLREGKMTLPLICALRNVNVADQQFIRNSIEQGDIDALPRLVELVQHSGALSQARASAQFEAQRAIEAITGLPNNPYKHALISLAEGLNHRRA